MRQHLVVALRIACMCGLLLGNAFLYRLLLSTGKPPTVFDTVYAHCVVTLVALVYYCVGKFCMTACYPPKHRPRRVSLVPRDADGNYVDMQLTTATEVVRGTPRLNLQNVWVFVYGVGFILFVAGYSVLGLNPLCLSSFGFGMGALALDELVCPRHAMSQVYSSVRVGAMLTATVAVCLVSLDIFRVEMLEFAAKLDIYSFVFSVCLPNVAPFLMIAVRDSRRFSVGSVLEVCEFGLPFTAFLGVFHLCVAYGQRFELENSSVMGHGLFLNETWNRAVFSAQIRTDGPFFLFYALTPLLVCPAVFAYVSCVLEGCSIDPLLAVGLTLCVHVLTEREVSPLGIYGTVCCGLAVCIRVIGEVSAELSPLPRSDPSQLSQDVIWERNVHRAAVADELTRELGESEVINA